jgi:hypothetical protein
MSENETQSESESVEAVVHDHYQLVAEGLQTEVDRLTKELERVNTYLASSRERASKYERQIKQAEEKVVELIDDEELDADSDIVEALKDIFDWTLTKEIKVVVTVKFTGTLTAPVGKSLEDFNDRGFDCDLSLDTYTNEDWEWSQEDADIDEIEED